MGMSWQTGTLWLPRKSPGGGSWGFRRDPSRLEEISTSASSKSTLP
jgi:hypothetical protein